jgi:hypothetical protein
MPGQSDSSPSWPAEQVSEPTEHRPRLRRVHFISLGAVIVVIVVAVVVVIGGHKTGTNGVPLPPVGTRVAGTVTSVSGTSITIRLGQATETATITKSTEFLGQVRSIGAVKVGDHVGAALTQDGGKQHAYALEDPFGTPSPALNGGE